MILKSPAEKLPLTARKNIRDEYEKKKPEYEATMKEVLGEAWTIEVNPNLIHEYASDDYKSRLGSVITWYLDAFIYNLKNFASSFGADGIQELNSVCSKHTLVFAPQEETKFSYGGLVVADQVLRLVFAEKALATNVDDVSRDFAGALKNAPPAPNASPFNLVARNAVRDDYDSKIEDLRSAITTMVNMPDLKLNPNFEHNASVLAKSPAQVKEGWDKRIGFITLSYFEGLRYKLNRENFSDDDLQQEAFQEAVSKGEVCIRVFDKWEDGKSRYNECKIEDGVLYLQTITDKWGVNVDDVAQKLLDVL